MVIGLGCRMPETSCIVLDSGSFVLPRCYSLIFLKGTDKIAQIIKSAPICNLRNGIIGGGKLITGFFYPLVVQIIHRCLMCHFGEKPAEIFRRHGNGGR